MQRVLVYIILIGIVYFFIKKYAKSFIDSSTPKDSKSEKPDGEMIRDPQCGAYFLKQQGVKGVVEGKVLHFCSEECYDNYFKRMSRD